MDGSNALLLIWSIISLILYVSVIIILLKNRKIEPFDSHFFSLFVSLGIADILATFHLYFYALFRYWGWIDFEPLMMSEVGGIRWLSRVWVYGFNYMIAFNQYIGVFWIALNRFLSIAHPHVAELYNDRLHPIAVGSQWLGAFVCGFAPWLTQDYKAIVIPVGENTTDSYTFISVFCENEAFDVMFGKVWDGVIWNLVTVVIGVLYVLCFWEIGKLKKEGVLTPADKSNMRLALVGLTVFLFMAGMNLTTVLAVFLSDVGEFLALFHYSCHVIFTLANPWLLLLCSKPIRMKFGAVFASGTTVEAITNQ